jgi:cytosine deaminase
MCTGACLLYKIPRVVFGENNTFIGGEETLRSRGVEVINLNDAECKELMRDFIEEHPEDWWVIMRG